MSDNPVRHHDIVRGSGTATQRIIDIVNQLLAQGEVIVRMSAVSARAPAWLEKGVSRQRSLFRSCLEIRELVEVAVIAAVRSEKVIRANGGASSP